MKFKAYVHRFGSVKSHDYDDLNKSIKETRQLEEAGEHFADCIVDESGVIVHDFRSLNDVFGVKGISSRVGEKFNFEEEKK